jgi:dihydrofolate reductase
MTLQIVGYAIVSADGMLADATGIMPETLKFDADQHFFAAALDHVDLIVHGRNSFEDQPRSDRRRRLIVTRQTAALAPDPGNRLAMLWNPAGAPFADACAAAGVTTGTAAIIGGGEVFGMFLERYAAFWLSQAHRVRLPGGVPVFPGVPARSPQALLAAHGLHETARQVLDADNDVTLTAWRR